MLEEEMGDVRTAAKVSLQELEKDVKTFKTELKDVEKVNYKFVVPTVGPNEVGDFSKSSIWSDFPPNSAGSTVFFKAHRSDFISGWIERIFQIRYLTSFPLNPARFKVTNSSISH